MKVTCGSHIVHNRFCGECISAAREAGFATPERVAEKARRILENHLPDIVAGVASAYRPAGEEPWRVLIDEKNPRVLLVESAGDPERAHRIVVSVDAQVGLTVKWPGTTF